MRRSTAMFLGVVVLALGAGPSLADERHFTYSYEAQTLPQGSAELEHWTTLRLNKDEGTFRLWQFRDEFEFGLTDSLTTAFYLNWQYKEVADVPDLDDEHELEIESWSSEWKYKLFDPTVDPVGVLLYGELTLGDFEYELEGKIVLHKHVGDFNFVYNFIFETEWERDEDRAWHTEYVITNTIGVSYSISPNVAIGVEGVNTNTFVKGLSEQEFDAWFVGPNVHVAFGSFWATLTVLKQVDLEGKGLEFEDHEEYEIRLIVSWSF